MELANLIGYLLTGAAAGITAGLLGVGGGVVTVPFLDFIWSHTGASQHNAFAIARGTSLAIMVFTSLSAAWGHYKKGVVRLPWAFRMATGGLFGAVLGSVLGTIVSAEFARGSFGLLALFVAFQFIRKSKTKSSSGEQPTSVEKVWRAYPMGLIVGLFSAFFGVGGGVVAVPLLTRFYKFRIHEAIGTSSTLIVALGLVGAFSYAGLGLKDGIDLAHCIGYIDLPALALIAAGSVVFARAGVHLAHKLPGRIVELLFAAYALAVAIKFLWPVLSSLEIF